MIRFPAGAMVGLLWTLTACDLAGRADADTAVAAARAARLATTIANSDSSMGSTAPLARWALPASLREISGLALSSDGRLFTHGDEQGEVWEVDYRHGVLIKQFTLGVKGDFEGITIVGDAFYLITSSGKLYEFREGVNGAQVSYKVRDPDLQKDCEFEGVAFDSTARVALLLCKNVKNKALADSLVIYRWSLTDPAGRAVPFAISLSRVIGNNPWKGLHPSDITVDPRTGHYVIIAAQESAMIELTATGEVVSAQPLPGSSVQAEGVAITRDGLVLISDEARVEPATISLFRWPVARAGVAPVVDTLDSSLTRRR